LEEKHEQVDGARKELLKRVDDVREEAFKVYLAFITTLLQYGCRAVFTLLVTSIDMKDALSSIVLYQAKQTGHPRQYNHTR